MGVLQKAVRSNAYLKMGLYGEAASGKTTTAILTAVGLIQKYGLRPALAFFDSETGLDFWIPRLEELGIEVFSTRSRSFNDLLDFTREAPSVADVAVVDSISHVYGDYRLAVWERVTRKRGAAPRDPRKMKGRMPFWVWGPIKTGWSEFTDAYTTSRLHTIMAGRAQNISETTEDEDGDEIGFKVIGKKMRAETETAYEPSLLVQMDREQIEGQDRFVQVATIMKDRFGVINGREFRFDAAEIEAQIAQTFEAFVPHIERLSLGGDHAPLDISRRSEIEGSDDDSGSFYHEQRARQIALQEIDGELTMRFPSTSKAEKIAKAGIKKVLFGTYSDDEIGQRDHAELRAAVPMVGYLADQIIKGAPPEGPALLDWLQGKKEEFGSGWSVELGAEADPLGEESESGVSAPDAGGAPTREDGGRALPADDTPGDPSIPDDPQAAVEYLCERDGVDIEAVKAWLRVRLACQRVTKGAWGTAVKEWGNVKMECQEVAA